MLLLIFVSIFLKFLKINGSSIEDYTVEKPVIGVLTQPSSWPKVFDPSEYSYIATSYVKFLESAGARVIPLRYNLERSALDKLLEKLNGVLFPGGGADLWELSTGMTDESAFTELMKTASHIMDFAKAQNDQGNYFPVWGTCLGYEMLILGISKDVKTFSYVNSTNWSQKLKYLNTSTKAKVFQDMPDRMKVYLSHEPALYFNHKYAVSPDSFYGTSSELENEKLRDFFTPLTVNNDQCDKTFVSMIEAKNYPFFGVQFHPEKGAFEWKAHLNINHSPGAIEADRYFIYFFLNEARKNKNKFPEGRQERKEFIYNYYPIQLSESFLSVYVFAKPNTKEILRAVFKTKKTMNFLQNSTFITSSKQSNSTSLSSEEQNSSISKSKNPMPMHKEMSKELMNLSEDLEKVTHEAARLKELMESIDAKLKLQAKS